ncbi:hypothetical protein Tco_1202402 [Tanacetum coccineum]
MELEDHVPVYILEPEHPEDLVPTEDEALIEPYITKVASAPTPPLPPTSLLPTLIRPPHTRAAMAQRRATAPSIYHSLLLARTPPLLPIPLPAPSTSRRADIPKADTPPRKRLLLTAPTPRVEVGESSAAAAARQLGSTMAYRVDHSFVDTVDTRVRDTERRTMAAIEVVNLRAIIDQGVTAILAARDANTNGIDSHNSGTGARRNERATRECTYSDFMKCQPLNFKGIEGVVELNQWIEKMETVFRISNCSVENQIKFSTCTLLGNALTWWNSHVRTVGNDIAYAMTWTELKKKISSV